VRRGDRVWLRVFLLGLVRVLDRGVRMSGTWGIFQLPKQRCFSNCMGILRVPMRGEGRL
jgi:hypothetical protein